MLLFVAMRVVVWNPMSAKRDRQEEIDEVMNFADVIVLTGTATKATKELQVLSTKNFHILPCGWQKQPGSMSNKSCGITFMFRKKRISRQHIRKVWLPQKAVWGRAAFVRIKSSQFDVTVGGFYFPPRGGVGYDTGKIETITRMLCEFVGATLAELPQRTSLIMGGDVNDGMGMERVGDYLQPVDSCSLGDFGRSEEHYAATHLRQVLEASGVVVLSTYWACGPTYYGHLPNRSSIIDYICVWSWMLPNINKCCLLNRLSRKLQIIPSKRPRDHIAMMVDYNHQLNYEGSEHQHTKWNYVEMSRAMESEQDAEPFRAAVEARISQRWDEEGIWPKDGHSHALKNNHEDNWMKLVDTVGEVAKEMFAAKPNLLPAWHTEAMDERRQALRARCRARQMYDDDLESALVLRRATARCKALRKQFFQQREEQLAEDLQEAERRQEHAEVWRICRQIASNGVAARKRNHKTLNHNQPTMEEWSNDMVLPASAGGFAAQEHDLLEFLFGQSGADEVYGPEPAEVKAAEKDLQRITKIARTCKRRRAVPVWSLPVEIWSLLLARRRRDNSKYPGIGLPEPEGVREMTTSWFKSVLAAIRQHQRFPTWWNMSQTYQVPKNNGKKSTMGTRLLHSLCSFSKLWIRAAPTKVKKYPSDEYGYIPARSRVEALMVGNCVSWRLSRAGRSHTDTKHDLTNAFASVNHSILDKAVTDNYNENDADILKQRHSNAIFKIDAHDEHKYFKNGTGMYMGDANAASQFREAFALPTKAWQQVLAHEGRQEVAGVCPHCAELKDLSLKKYADDINKTHLVTDAKDTVAKVSRSDQILNATLANAGLEQSPEKKMVLPRFVGRGAAKNTKAMYYGTVKTPGQVVYAATFLGAITQANGADNLEIQARCAATTTGWLAMGRFWSTCKNWRHLKMIFRSRVVGAAVSGLEARVLAKHHLAQLDRRCLRYARAVLGGVATRSWHKDDEGNNVQRFNTISNQAVWKLLGVVPCGHELLVRRIKMWQSVARDPGHHCQLLAAVFGKAVFESPSPHRCSWAPSLATDLDNSKHNPWATQFRADIDFLEKVEDGQSVLEAMEGDYMSLFREGDAREQFLILDAAVLRVWWLHQKAEQTTTAADEEGEVLYSEFVCELEAEGGESCGKCFRSWQALRMHQTKTGGGEHGRISVFTQAVPTNQCPCCFSTFASRRTAINHLVAAYRAGRCAERRSWHNHGVTQPTLECPHQDCAVADPCPSFDTLAALNHHIAEQHLPQPLPLSTHVLDCRASLGECRCIYAAGIKTTDRPQLGPTTKRARRSGRKREEVEQATQPPADEARPGRSIRPRRDEGLVPSFAEACLEQLDAHSPARCYLAEHTDGTRGAEACGESTGKSQAMAGKERHDQAGGRQRDRHKAGADRVVERSMSGGHHRGTERGGRCSRTSECNSPSQLEWQAGTAAAAGSLRGDSLLQVHAGICRRHDEVTVPHQEPRHKMHRGGPGPTRWTEEARSSTDVAPRTSIAHQAVGAHGRRHLIEEKGAATSVAESDCTGEGNTVSPQHSHMSRAAWKKQLECKIAIPALLGKPPRENQKRIRDSEFRSAAAAKHLRSLGGDWEDAALMFGRAVAPKGSHEARA